MLFDEGQEDPKPPTDEFEEAKPLAEELIDTLVDLLFFSDLTVPKQPHGKPKVTYAIWQSGVGCNTAVATTKEYENNRCEILRLLLTLASQSMYLSPSVLPTKGAKALTYICTCPDKQVVLSMLCSLLNTVSFGRGETQCLLRSLLTLLLCRPSNTTQQAGASLTTL